jgi:hypothetical protein
MGFVGRYLGSHLSFGPFVIYGQNAMHWAVNIRIRGGYLCFRLPLLCFGRWWPLYAYWSENATPWHHSCVGFGHDKSSCVCDDCLINARGRYADNPMQRLSDLVSRGQANATTRKL